MMAEISSLAEATDKLSDLIYANQEEIEVAEIEPCGSEKRKVINQNASETIIKMQKLNKDINAIYTEIAENSSELKELEARVIRVAKNSARIATENVRRASSIRSFKSLSFFNLKGGVSKTGSSFQVGTMLGQMGHRVLFIDNDPQGNLSYFCDTSETEFDYMSVKHMLQDNLPAEEVIQETKNYPNVDIIACDIELTEVESYLQNKKTGREFAFRNWVSDNIDYLNRYDYIIGDLSPSLGYLNINYLLVADSIVYLVTPTKPAIKGVLSFERQYSKYIEPITQVEKKKAMILNMIEDGTKISKDFKVYQNSLEQFKDYLIETNIHKATAFQKYTEIGKTLDAQGDKYQKRLYNEYVSVIDELKGRRIL